MCPALILGEYPEYPGAQETIVAHFVEPWRAHHAQALLRMARAQMPLPQPRIGLQCNGSAMQAGVSAESNISLTTQTHAPIFTRVDDLRGVNGWQWDGPS